jgi:hypothetical protein
VLTCLECMEMCEMIVLVFLPNTRSERDLVMKGNSYQQFICFIICVKYIFIFKVLTTTVLYSEVQGFILSLEIKVFHGFSHCKQMLT